MRARTQVDGRGRRRWRDRKDHYQEDDDVQRPRGRHQIGGDDRRDGFLGTFYSLSGVCTLRLLEERCKKKKKNVTQRTTKHRPFFFTCRRRGVHVHLSSRSKSSSSLRSRLTKKRFFLSENLILPRRRRRRRKRRRPSVHFFLHSSLFHNSQIFSLCFSRNSSLCDR